MSICRLLTLTAVVSLSISTAKANTYDHYIKRLSQHPSVLHLIEQGDSYQSLSKSSVSLPDPQLIIGLDNIPLSDPSFDRFLPSSKVIGFRQAIPNPKAREHKAKLQKNLLKKNRLITQYQVKRLEAQFTVQLVELQKVNTLEKLLKEQLELYRLAEKDLRGQLEAGKSVYVKFSGLDVERAEVEQKLNALRAERATIQETLIELVDTIPNLSPPKVNVLNWVRNETPLYPALIAFESTVVGQSNVDIAEADFKPNYGVQALYKQRESGDNFEGDDWFSIQASVSIPIWSKSNQTPKLKSAQAMMRSAQSMYEQTTRHWNQRMATLQAEQKYALDNIELFKKKKKALKQMIASAERNYESGNTPLEDVLNAQINHLNIAAKLISQQSRYQTLIIDFNSHIQTNESRLGGSHAEEH